MGYKRRRIFKREWHGLEQAMSAQRVSHRNLQNENQRASGKQGFVREHADAEK
jgi:hypothetical protein